MTIRRKLAVAVMSLVLAAGFGPLAEAAAGKGQRDRDTKQDSERAISLDEAVARAERRYKARVVRAEEKRHGNRIEYRIRLLADDGRVFQVRIDAATGRED